MPGKGARSIDFNVRHDGAVTGYYLVIYRPPRLFPISRVRGAVRMPCDSHGMSHKLAHPEGFELLTPRFVVLFCEKLMNFANAASRHPDFVRELPRFVSEVRRMFTPDEIGAHLEQIERAQSEQDVDVLDEDDPLREKSRCSRGANPAVHADQGITDRDHAWYFMTGPAEALLDGAGGL